MATREDQHDHCKSPAKLSKTDKEILACLSERSDVLKEAISTAQEFRLIMENKDATRLVDLMYRAMASKIKELSGFAGSMINDLKAVQNAISMDWSNGQVEGQVNKLKTIKRQMYGRATLALLRKRLAYHSAFK